MPKPRKRPAEKTLRVAEEFPIRPPLTEQESLASRIAYERCKPALDVALAKLHTRLNRPILPLAEEAETRRHIPNVYYRCAEHGLPLDPWGLCHYDCKRCEREKPFERIWTHKGGHQAAKAVLVSGA